MVLVVSELVLGTSPEILEGDDSDKRPFKKLLTRAENWLKAFRRGFRLGTSLEPEELSRFPHEDVHVVDGVKCYLPKDMLTIIGKRTICPRRPRAPVRT